jgi:hypothetical protein
VDPVDQFTFVVGLAEFDFQAMAMGSVGTALGQVSQGFVAILSRLAGS